MSPGAWCFSPDTGAIPAASGAWCFSPDTGAIPAATVLAFFEYAPRVSPPASLGLGRKTSRLLLTERWVRRERRGERPISTRSLAMGALLAGGACALACGGMAGRDVVPESVDVRVTDASAPAPPAERGYEYVARRPMALVALAESRGISQDVAREAVDRLADALDACATEQGRKGHPVDGAARIVAPIEQDGTVGPPSLRVDPAPGVAQSAVICLAAPVRLLTFPSADAGTRGLAIEALWGHLIPH
jgi:hypothetical protein